MGIVDVWQSFNARKGEGGTDRYIRVACLSARERKLAAIPPYHPPLVPSFDPPLQIRHVWLVTFHRDVTFPRAPSIAQRYGSCRRTVLSASTATTTKKFTDKEQV